MLALIAYITNALLNRSTNRRRRQLHHHRGRVLSVVKINKARITKQPNSYIKHYMPGTIATKLKHKYKHTTKPDNIQQLWQDIEGHAKQEEQHSRKQILSNTRSIIRQAQITQHLSQLLNTRQTSTKQSQQIIALLPPIISYITIQHGTKTHIQRNNPVPAHLIENTRTILHINTEATTVKEQNIWLPHIANITYTYRQRGGMKSSAQQWWETDEPTHTDTRSRASWESTQDEQGITLQSHTHITVEEGDALMGLAYEDSEQDATGYSFKTTTDIEQIIGTSSA